MNIFSELEITGEEMVFWPISRFFLNLLGGNE
jgi:hypothetical protein